MLSRARSIRPNFPEISVQNLEIRFENFVQHLEVVLFSGNLEIPEISCSIWHFYPEFCLDQSYKMAVSRHYTGCKTICHSSSQPALGCLSFTKTLPGSDFLDNCGLVVPNFARYAKSPARKVRKFLSSDGYDV